MFIDFPFNHFFLGGAGGYSKIYQTVWSNRLFQEPSQKHKDPVTVLPFWKDLQTAMMRMESQFCKKSSPKLVVKDGDLTIPYHPCMEYLPTFTINLCQT